MSKRPSMPPPDDEITPLPDGSGAAIEEKMNTIKRMMRVRGRSSTLKTFYQKRTGDLSGRLSDVPMGPREGTEIIRGS